MPAFSIRAAQPSDSEQILKFVTELATFEKAADEVEASVADIERTLFGDSATSHCILCEQDNQPVGFAVYFYNYSTWQGRNGLYLEDLYITPEFRGKGAGTEVLKYLARHAIANNCGRFEWSVLDWNQPAIDFYESLGAVAKSEWLGYRLSGDALTHFANS